MHLSYASAMIFVVGAAAVSDATEHLDASTGEGFVDALQSARLETLRSTGLISVQPEVLHGPVHGLNPSLEEHPRSLRPPLEPRSLLGKIFPFLGGGDGPLVSIPINVGSKNSEVVVTTTVAAAPTPVVTPPPPPVTVTVTATISTTTVTPSATPSTAGTSATSPSSAGATATSSPAVTPTTPNSGSTTSTTDTPTTAGSSASTTPTTTPSTTTPSVAGSKATTPSTAITPATAKGAAHTALNTLPHTSAPHTSTSRTSRTSSRTVRRHTITTPSTEIMEDVPRDNGPFEVLRRRDGGFSQFSRDLNTMNVPTFQSFPSLVDTSNQQPVVRRDEPASYREYNIMKRRLWRSATGRTSDVQVGRRETKQRF